MIDCYRHNQLTNTITLKVDEVLSDVEIIDFRNKIESHLTLRHVVIDINTPQTTLFYKKIFQHLAEKYGSKITDMISVKSDKIHRVEKANRFLHRTLKYHFLLFET